LTFCNPVPSQAGQMTSVEGSRGFFIAINKNKHKLNHLREDSG
jgi:hypothetical protein